MPSTVRFHRVLRAAPEKVYKAFLDPEAMEFHNRKFVFLSGPKGVTVELAEWG